VNKLLLMGNPNVGKSSIFTRLTGVETTISNYPGTTVEFSKGYYNEEKVSVIDIPGIYSFDVNSPAAAIALEMLDESMRKKDSIVINVIDATNLERNLNLTLQVVKKKIPVIVVLNFWDETKHEGISIDEKKLEEILGVPVVPTVGVTGKGIKELTARLHEASICRFEFEDENKWNEIGKIINNVQTINHKHHTIRERLRDLTIHPWAGPLIAMGVLFLVFESIRFIGEGLIGYVFEPLFKALWEPVIMIFSSILGGEGLLHDILIGKLINGEIDFGQSLGLLTSGIFIPIGAVLPYIFAFYLILSILEDIGYLPRLAILLDRMMHIVGLHGMSFIPFLLGIGCNVPGALATRVLETRKERFIAGTLMAIAIPCMAQIAMIFGLLGKHGYAAMFPVVMSLFLVWLIVGIIMRYAVKGFSPEIIAEIPAYRFPYMEAILKKVWMRIKWFLKEALPFVLLGVFIVNMLYSLGIIQAFGNIAEPVVTNMLGLPKETVGALMVGFLRKDLAVGMLAPLGLTLKQLIIASVVLTMYFPCAATFAVLLKELGFIDMLKSALIMVLSTLAMGSLLNLILQ